MAAGFSQILAGHGFHTMTGVGHRSITAHGFSIQLMDGFGCPVTTGLRHGLYGEHTATITGGRHVLRVFQFQSAIIHQLITGVFLIRVT
jgi:hypothetical protein